MRFSQTIVARTSYVQLHLLYAINQLGQVARVSIFVLSRVLLDGGLASAHEAPGLPVLSQHFFIVFLCLAQPQSREEVQDFEYKLVLTVDSVMPVDG